MKAQTPQLLLQGIHTALQRAEHAALTPALRQQIESALKEAVHNTAGLPAGENFSSRVVTILLTDLRGFTAILESHPAPELLDVLNRYLLRMSEIAFEHGGTIDKFIGDSIMVLFGAPESREDDVKRAVA